MIEVIVALTLIILFLSGVIVVELFAVRNAEYARSKSIATIYANQQLERARVIRDTAGMNAMDSCLTSCYINNLLTPVPVPMDEVYIQSLTLDSAAFSECPAPGSYKVIAKVEWSEGLNSIETSTCMADRQ